MNELHGKLKASDSCKIQVEEASKQLQLEVDAIKRAQKVKETRPVEPRDLSTLLEGIKEVNFGGKNPLIFFLFTIHLFRPCSSARFASTLFY